MAAPSWTASPHRPLETLADGLWRLDAEMSSPPFQRHMTIARLSTGELVVHSAVTGDEPTMAHIDSLGRVAYIVVPSGFHRMDAPRYAARYPQAKVVAPRAAGERVRQVVRLDGGLELLPTDAALRWEPLEGAAGEAVLLHTDTRGALTAIFNDAFFNLPHMAGWRGLVNRTTRSAGGPRVTPIARMVLVKDKPAFAAHLRRLAALPGLARIVPGHGEVIATDPAAALEQAAAGLA